MSKTIQFPDNQGYILALEETKRMIKELEEDLFVQAVNLCNCSCWKDWGEKKEDGEAFEFDTNMLKQSGDKNAALLIELMAILNEVESELN
jgi:hypothetical protein